MVAACGDKVADDCKTPLLTVRQTDNPPGIDVAVDLSRAETSTLTWGLLHGMNYYDPVNRTYTDAVATRLDALSPQAWRVAGTKGAGGTTWGFGAFHPFITDYRYPERFGTRVVFNLQEVVGANHGKPMRVGLCGPRSRSCWPTFDALRTSWNVELGAFLDAHCGDDGLDYFELTSEPEYHSFEGVTHEQLYLLMLDAYQLAKACRPGAKFIAPSTVGWNQKLMEGLATFARDNGMHLDAISWHEFGDDAVPRYSPNAITAHVTAARALFGDDVELHINEYASGMTSSSPGHALGWLAALEAAGIDMAIPGCWELPFEGREVSTCWDDFNGLLMPAPSTTPQPLYWLYEAWHALGHSRFHAEAAPAELHVIAGQRTGGSISVLVGNGGITRTEDCHYLGIDREAATTLRLTHVPGGLSRLRLWKISSHAAGVSDLFSVNAYGTPLETPELVAEYAVEGDTLDLSLPPITAGDVYVAVLGE